MLWLRDETEVEQSGSMIANVETVCCTSLNISILRRLCPLRASLHVQSKHITLAHQVQRHTERLVKL